MSTKQLVAVMDDEALIAAMVAIKDKEGAFREHAQKAVTDSARQYAQNLAEKLARAHDALMTAKEVRDA
jgi:hypothetical protein